MRVLVTGGSASGKSEFAELYLQMLIDAAAVNTAIDGEASSIGKSTTQKYYIATMPIFGPEDEARKEKHLRARQGRGFVTIEQTDDLSSLRLPGTNGVGTRRFALLEDIGNLAANEIFGNNGVSGAADRVASGALFLASQCECVVVVSVDVARDGICYDPETCEYIRIIEQVNRSLAAEFDEVYEVFAGLPKRIK